jgi:hypothetical protein
MRSGIMMILKVTRQHAAQVALAEDNNVIQAFTTDRTDKTFDVRVLPRRSPGCDDLRDAHRPNPMTKCWTIRFVSVPQEIARCSVPGKSLGHLTGKPDLRGISRDLEVNNPSALEV